ncbi:MAG: TetR/AcrR family transcriptional regulator [Thermomicrobiales bacterium]
MPEAKRIQRREATRREILDAAVKIASAEGWPGVTMRKVADRVNYSHPALYAYFATKDDLLLALLREGLALYARALEEAVASAITPEAAVLAMADVLWEFPWQRPELYQVMHGLGGVAFATRESREEGRATITPAVAVVASLLAAHGRDPADAERVCTLFWCTIHGLVTLTMAGRFTREEGAALAISAARETLEAWTTAPAPHSDLS